MKEEIKTKTPDNTLGYNWDWVAGIAEGIIANVNAYNATNQLIWSREGRECKPVSPEGLRHFLNSTDLVPLAASIEKYADKITGIELLAKEQTEDHDSDVNTIQKIKTSSESLRELHYHVMLGLYSLAKDYYKAFGEAEWFANFLANPNKKIDLELLDDINKELNEETKAIVESSNPNSNADDTIKILNRKSIRDWAREVRHSLPEPTGLSEMLEAE
jgi:hypothetical protein